MHLFIIRKQEGEDKRTLVIGNGNMFSIASSILYTITPPDFVIATDTP